MNKKEDVKPKADSSKTGRSRFPTDYGGLLQQCRSHEIELARRNEELRQMSIALNLSREHYKELYDLAPVGYLTLIAKGIIVEANETAAKLIGIERKHLINKHLDDFIEDEFKERWRKHFLLATQTKGKNACELPLRHEHGNIIYAHLDCLSIDADNAPPQIRVTLTEITELKKAEHELRIAATAFETLEGIIITDANRIIQRVNQAFTSITGYSAEEAVGKTPSFLRSERYDPSFYEALWVRIFQDNYWEGEIWEKRKNGGLFLMRIVFNAVKDHHGQISHYVGAFTDVTEREEAVAELRIAAAAFETLDGIIVADARKKIIRVNAAFSAITGYSPEEAKMLSFLDSKRHNSDTYHGIWTAVEKDGHWEGEIWEPRKNGVLFPLRICIAAVRDSDQAIKNYVASFTDITAQKQAEKILLDARERLESQAATTQEELEKNKAETAEINAALNVLLKHREMDKTEAQISLSYNIEATVLPLLRKLKGVSTSNGQATRIVDMLEANLQHIMKSYGRANHIDGAYKKLTPIETQVAAMVKLGQPTKTIAATLYITPGTVNIHRKHIRKKLGLDSKTNLQRYLQSLAD